jgi:hypothetical protein
MDSLGPSLAKGGTGAPELRSQIFDYLQGYMPQMNQAGATYANALQKAAGDTGWQSAQDVARRTAAGDYLNGSPALDRATAWNRAQTEADAANQNARIRSNYAQNGMGFSTGAQEAQQSNNAAANANASATNANTYLQNYLTERGNQNNSGQMLGQAQQGPLSYLGNVSGAYAQPASQIGQLLSGLSTGQVVQTGGTYSPSLGSSILQGVGAL